MEKVSEKYKMLKQIVKAQRKIWSINCMKQNNLKKKHHHLKELNFTMMV
jgi:hypothetical protein